MDRIAPATGISWKCGGGVYVKKSRGKRSRITTRGAAHLLDGKKTTREYTIFFLSSKPRTFTLRCARRLADARLVAGHWARSRFFLAHFSRERRAAPTFSRGNPGQWCYVVFNRGSRSPRQLARRPG